MSSNGKFIILLFSIPLILRGSTKADSVVLGVLVGVFLGLLVVLLGLVLPLILLRFAERDNDLLCGLDGEYILLLKDSELGNSSFTFTSSKLSLRGLETVPKRLITDDVLSWVFCLTLSSRACLSFSSIVKWRLRASSSITLTLNSTNSDMSTLRGKAPLWDFPLRLMRLLVVERLLVLVAATGV